MWLWFSSPHLTFHTESCPCSKHRIFNYTEVFPEFTGQSKEENPALSSWKNLYLSRTRNQQLWHFLPQWWGYFLAWYPYAISLKYVNKYILLSLRVAIALTTCISNFIFCFWLAWCVSIIYCRVPLEQYSMNMYKF